MITIRPLLVILMLGLIGGCGEKPGSHRVDALFVDELDKRGYEHSLAPDGHYGVEINGHKFDVDLDPARRQFDRNFDPGVAQSVIDKLEAAAGGPPSWADMAPRIRYLLEPPRDKPADDFAIQEPVTEYARKVYVIAAPDGSRITRVSERMLERWGIKREHLVAQAETNMKALLASATFEILDYNGLKLGVLKRSQEAAFTGSLVLSEGLRELVSPTVGWPVYVIVPRRETAYVVRVGDERVLDEIADQVVREYETADHPVALDFFERTEHGADIGGVFFQRKR